MTKFNGTPPRFFIRFFRWFCIPELRNSIEGDLLELYHERVSKAGKRNADVKFALDVLLLFRPGMIRSVKRINTINHCPMLKSYFKIALRNLLKSKVYSGINIVGLAAGMTVAILIGLWMWDELSYDSYFDNRKRLAKVMLNQTHEGVTYTGGTIAMPLGDALRTEYAADFKGVSLASWMEDHLFTVGDKKISRKGMCVQQEFPKMFSLKLLGGSVDALIDPSTVMISASLANALFGDANPVNKAVRVDNKLDMVVGGVYEDLPHNTTFYGLDFLLPWGNKENWRNGRTTWENHCGQLFVQLAEHADMAKTSLKIKNVPTPHIKELKEEIMLQPLERLHLYDAFENGKEAGGRIQFVWLLGIIGVFVLLLACINFMNLSTARSEKRAKEVGIRKTMGSLRPQLIWQFLSESIVMACLAFVLSLILAQSMLPFFNMLADKQMSISWNNPWFWLLILGFTLFTGIIAGSYPAFYLSGFIPVKVLKGTLKVGRAASLPRKVLVVLQFTVSITLIIGTAIVFLQIQYAKNRLTGYNRNGLITVKMNTPDLQRHHDAIKHELLQTGAVENMAESSHSPAYFDTNNSVEWKGKDPNLVSYFRNVDVTPAFGNTIGWTIKEGRDFSSDFPTDSTAVILNETALKITGLTNPLGEIIKFRGKEYTIIGVVNDMLTQSPYRPMEPSIFFTDGWRGVMIIRIKDNMPVREALAKIEPIFRTHNPHAPFEFSFVDEAYAKKFSNEERIGSLAAFFAILAIFISCLGLFGLASFVAEQRTKEIGIRKVLGASVANLWRLLSKDFVILVIISCLIAIPISFSVMNNWLQQYEYRTPVSWYIFAVTGGGVLVITLLTVSYQAMRSALSNPVNSLRAE